MKFPARTDMLWLVARANIHVSFVMTLVTGWKLTQDDLSLNGAMLFLAAALSYFFWYALRALPEHITTQDTVYSCVKATMVSIHALWAIGIANETDLLTFCFLDKGWGVGFCLISLTLIDLKLMLCLYAGEASLLIWNQWRLVDDKMSSLGAYAIFVSHIFVLAATIFTNHTMKSIIAAKVDSSDASSLMLGFRQVLRGVCDGDVLLDSGCNIVDDASCLERLLKSRKNLSKTNFLDLFLDAQSRDGFLHFLNTQDATSAAVPRGLRVRLQGAVGPVSVDVFHTKVPKQGATGNDLCLLALKEDPEQSAPPEAPEAEHGAVAASSAGNLTGSTVSEVIEAFDELAEIALLVSNETASFDIKEAHLAFRQPQAPIECGMPSLRKFIRPSDWDRFEQMFDTMINLPPTGIRQRCTFRRPMLFRLPGESRSYLCSKQTSVCLAAEVQPDQPVHFWMHFSSFDTSHIRRPREQELQAIREEWQSLVADGGGNLWQLKSQMVQRLAPEWGEGNGVLESWGYFHAYFWLGSWIWVLFNCIFCVYRRNCQQDAMSKVLGETDVIQEHDTSS